MTVEGVAVKVKEMVVTGNMKKLIENEVRGDGRGGGCHGDEG